MSTRDDFQVMFPEVSQNHYIFSVPGEHYTPTLHRVI